MALNSKVYIFEINLNKPDALNFMNIICKQSMSLTAKLNILYRENNTKALVLIGLKK